MGAIWCNDNESICGSSNKCEIGTSHGDGDGDGAGADASKRKRFCRHHGVVWKIQSRCIHIRRMMLYRKTRCLSNGAPFFLTEF